MIDIALACRIAPVFAIGNRGIVLQSRAVLHVVVVGIQSRLSLEHDLMQSFRRPEVLAKSSCMVNVCFFGHEVAYKDLSEKETMPGVCVLGWKNVCLL